MANRRSQHPPLPLVSERTLDSGRAGYPHRRQRIRNCNVYSDEDKARGLVLAAIATPDGAARCLPIPRETLRDWLAGRGLNPNVIQMAKHFSDEMGDAFEDVVRRITASMGAKIDGAGLKDSAIAIGILVDKSQLLRGLPTAIEGKTQMSNEARAARLAEIIAKAESLPEPAIDAEFTDLGDTTDEE